MFLGFFILKCLKSETLLVLLAEAKLIILSVTLSLNLHNQFGFRASEALIIEASWGLDYWSKLGPWLLKQAGRVTEITRIVRSPFHNKIYNLIKWSHLVSLSRPSCFSQNGVSRYACACQLNSCNQLIPPPQKNSDSITHAQPSKKIKKDVADFQNSRIHWVWQRRYDRLKCCEITVGKWRVEVY